jgi:hypothetical protein
MRSSHTVDRIDTAFDDERRVAAPLGARAAPRSGPWVGASPAGRCPTRPREESRSQATRPERS